VLYIPNTRHGFIRMTPQPTHSIFNLASVLPWTF
jgi:hypothetical protein